MESPGSGKCVQLRPQQRDAGKGLSGKVIHAPSLGRIAVAPEGPAQYPCRSCQNQPAKALFNPLD